MKYNFDINKLKKAYAKFLTFMIIMYEYIWLIAFFI